MNKGLPGYKHIRCDCGGAIRLGESYWLGRCDDCGKEIKLTPYIDYQNLFRNEKTGRIYPTVDYRKD